MVDSIDDACQCPFSPASGESGQFTADVRGRSAGPAVAPIGAARAGLRRNSEASSKKAAERHDR